VVEVLLSLLVHHQQILVLGVKHTRTHSLVHELKSLKGEFGVIAEYDLFDYAHQLDSHNTHLQFRLVNLAGVEQVPPKEFNDIRIPLLECILVKLPFNNAQTAGKHLSKDITQLGNNLVGISIMCEVLVEDFEELIVFLSIQTIGIAVDVGKEEVKGEAEEFSGGKGGYFVWVLLAVGVVLGEFGFDEFLGDEQVEEVEHGFRGDFEQN
jgi:hypothetical protein